MTSEAKRAANRANAQKSTGPRSTRGQGPFEPERHPARPHQVLCRRSCRAGRPCGVGGQPRGGGGLASPPGSGPRRCRGSARCGAGARRPHPPARPLDRSPACAPPPATLEASAAVLINPHLFETLALAGTLDHAALAVPGPAARGARNARRYRPPAGHGPHEDARTRNERAARAEARSGRAHRPQPRSRPLRAPRPVAPPHGRASLGRAALPPLGPTPEPPRGRRQRVPNVLPRGSALTGPPLFDQFYP